jgi:hypothetical protein
MNKPSEFAFNFEGVLLGATKDKNGYVIKVVIHPNDIPDDLVRDLVGTRYQFAAVRLGDDGTPQGKKKVSGGGGEVQHAALLCKNPNFQQYCEQNWGALHVSEEDARSTILQYCNIQSRAELGNDERARRWFHELVQLYEKWLLATPAKET